MFGLTNFFFTMLQIVLCVFIIMTTGFWLVSLYVDTVGHFVTKKVIHTCTYMKQV